MSKSFVLFVPAGGIDNSSARTRMYAYLPFLKEFGFRWHITNYTYHKYDAPKTDRRFETKVSLRPGLPEVPHKCSLRKLWLELLPLRNLWAFFRADTLFFQKKRFRPWIVKLGRLLGKRIVYDLDDALYLQSPDPMARAAVHAIRVDEEFAPRLVWMFEQANLALVSSEELSRYASQHAQAVSILPSVVSEVADMPSVPNTTPVIGWVGAPENQCYLREIEDVLVKLTDENPELEVWIVTSQLMRPAPRFRYKFIPWTFFTEKEVIPLFTVGIAPLRDDLWCRAKMNFKALVYMSYGVPVVAGPFGALTFEFEDGRSVLLARTEADWYRYLKDLLCNPERRNEIADNGLKVIRQRYWAPARVAEFAAALRGQSREYALRVAARQIPAVQERGSSPD